MIWNKKFNLIKPIIRLKGSKYRMTPHILDMFAKSGLKKFVEPFGGTGIVSMNIKHNFPETIVWLNDYDHLYPITESKVLKNLLSYEGLGKHITRQAIDKYNIRVKNGLWDKFKKYKEVAQQLNITHMDFTNGMITSHKDSFYFIDPPYEERIYLYEGYVSLQNVRKFIMSLDKSNKWVLTYNDSDELRESFAGYPIYFTNKSKTKEGEVIVCSEPIDWEGYGYSDTDQCGNDITFVCDDECCDGFIWDEDDNAK